MLERFVVVSQFEVFGCLGPFLPLSRVVTKVLVCLFEHLIVTSSRLHQADNSRPVTKPHSQVEGQIFPVNILEDLFSLVVPFEENGDFRLLFNFLIQISQPVDQLHSVIILVFDEGPFRHLQVELVEGSLTDQFPEPLLRVLFNKIDRFFQTDSGQEVTCLTECFCLILYKHVFDVLNLFGVLQHIVK